MYTLSVIKSENGVSYCSRDGDSWFLHAAEDITPKEALALAYNYAAFNLESVTFTRMLPTDEECNANSYLLTRFR